MQYVPGNSSIVDLETISTKELVALIIEARGARSAAWLRTKLNQRLERRNGRRGLGGARDKVLSNGGLRASL